MNLADFDAFADKFMEEQRSILKAKGADYAGHNDRLSNFKEVAKLLGTKPEHEWGTYFLKHVFAVLSWIRTGHVESEGLRGRFLDLANYAILGAALAQEAEEGPVRLPAIKALSWIPPLRFPGVRLATEVEEKVIGDFMDHYTPEVAEVYKSVKDGPRRFFLANKIFHEDPVREKTLQMFLDGTLGLPASHVS